AGRWVSSQARSPGWLAVPRSRVIRLAVVSASGEITNRLAARVSALTIHQPMVSPPRETLAVAGPDAEAEVVRTYRELFAVPEFRPLFWTSSVQVAAQTISGLALATLIYDRTRSPLLSALAMFGPALTQLVGASTLLAAADRLPARALISGLSLAFGAGTAAPGGAGLPIWAAFAILAVQGLGGSLTGAVRYGLLTDVLTADGYLL